MLFLIESLSRDVEQRCREVKNLRLFSFAPDKRSVETKAWFVLQVLLAVKYSWPLSLLSLTLATG
jgi:hypothetical protein